MSDYSWTQPCCLACWARDNSDALGLMREPVTVVEKDEEVCVHCGEPTWAGIYIRIDPRMPNIHPTIKRGE